MARWLLPVAVCACSSKAAGPPDAPTPAWSPGPPIVDRAGDARRLEPGVAALGNQLVVLGGFNSSLLDTPPLTITTQIEVLDTSAAPDQQTWSSPWPDVPVQWTHIQLAAVGTSLYLLGGLEDDRATGGQLFSAKGTAYRLDTQVTPLEWKPLAPIPAGFERGSAAVIVAPPRIYLLGGANTTDSLATNIFYDITADAWCADATCPDLLPDLPNGPRSHPAGMRRADGTLVVTGGLTTIDATEPDADTQWLPPKPTSGAWQWQAKAPMPFAHGGCAYGVIGERLLCAGGEAGQSALHFTYAYDANLDLWATLENMPAERAGAQGATIGQRLYLPGGAEQLIFQPLDTLFVYDALLDTTSSRELGSP